MRKVGEEHPPFVVFDPLVAAVRPHALELLHLQVARRPPAPRRGVPARVQDQSRALLNRLESGELVVFIGVVVPSASEVVPHLAHVHVLCVVLLSGRVVHALTYPGNLPRAVVRSVPLDRLGRPGRGGPGAGTIHSGAPGPSAAVAGLVGVGDVGVGVELFVVVYEGRRRFARYRRVVAVASGTAELNQRGRAIVARRIVVVIRAVAVADERRRDVVVVVVVVCGGRITHPHPGSPGRPPLPPEEPRFHLAMG